MLKFLLLVILFVLIIPSLLLGLFMVTIDKVKVVRNIYETAKFPFRFLWVLSLFKRLNNTQRRDLWLYSTMIEDGKWYNRIIEKRIRKKYIEPIINGTV